MVMWIGIIIVIATFYLIIKGFESRAVLLTAGFILSAMGGGLGGLFDAFNSQLLSTSMTPIITASMAFGAVMEYTKCTDHLIHAIIKPMRKIKAGIVPLAFLATCLINISVTSASGCAAAVGALLIPTMLSLGVNPISAAAAVVMGTWCGSLNPGDAFNAQIADAIGNTATVEEIWLFHIPPAITCIIIIMVLMTVLDILSNRKKVASDPTATITEMKEEAEVFKINAFKAICPVVPIILVLLGTFGILPNLNLAIWMLVGSIVGMIADWKEPTGAIKAFFGGLGKSFGDIVALIACATAFTHGIKAVGLTDALIGVMLKSSSLAKITAVGLPFTISILSGSGNAAIAAFNSSVLPYAADMGMNGVAMGVCAKLAGAIARSASPVSACAIICARFAGVSPMHLTKRTIIPALVVAVVLIVIFI